MNDVRVNVDGSIWRIEIDRPRRANALRRQTIREIEESLDHAEASAVEAHSTTGDAAGADLDSVGGGGAVGVVLTGSVGRFSAGADLGDLTGGIDDLGFDEELERLTGRITRSPLAVVAAVEGVCYGAAVDLAWACDAVVVSEDARLAVPSTILGILYNPASMVRLHARLGSAALRRLMVLQQELSGSQLPAGAAITVAAGTAADTAERLLRSVSADHGAIAATKELLASLDNGDVFDPAAWQPRRTELLASPARWAALESRRSSIGKEHQ